MSWPTPFTVLQPASAPNMPHKTSVAINDDAKILLIMMYLLSQMKHLAIEEPSDS